MFMRTAEKIVGRGPLHRSRLHDEKGNRLPLAGFVYLPHSVITTVLRKSVGYRPVRPWLGYRALNRLDQLIQPEWKMLEFGSGMSTLWFARRCREVISIEHDDDWYWQVREMLDQAGMRNVRYEHRPVANYARLEDVEDKSLDFVLIDGAERGQCAASALRKVRDGGYIYLDNSDKHSDGRGGDTRVAEEILLDGAISRGGEIEYFVDLIPTYIQVVEGMLVRTAQESS